MYRAAGSGNLEVCKYLIEHGTDEKARKKDIQTVLYRAAGSGDLEVCKYLIEKGADVKEMKVSQEWNDKVKEYLLSQGGILEEAKGID